jgi:hypothetical protein
MRDLDQIIIHDVVDGGRAPSSDEVVPAAAEP